MRWPMVRFQRGSICTCGRTLKGAIREFRRSVGLAPNSAYSVDASSYMANAYLALGDTDGAVKAYQAALKRSPNRDDYLCQSGKPALFSRAV